MGYLLPIIPFHSIQYSNRIDFKRENRQSIKSLARRGEVSPLSMQTYNNEPFVQLSPCTWRQEDVREKMEEHKKVIRGMNGMGLFIDVYV